MSLFSEGMNALLAFQWGTLFPLYCRHICEITRFQNKVKSLETTLSKLMFKLSGACY